MSSLSQSDIQEQLQRFQTRFSAWLGDALEPLATDRDPTLRRAALDLQLRFSASALDIAIGPNPDAGLLDMVTLVELARSTIVEHWIPQVFHQHNTAALQEAVDRSSADVWQVARQVLSSTEEAQLRRIIDEWKAANPDQLRVAGMRLPAFATPGDAGFGKLTQAATGLFAGVRKAVQTADQTRLLAERALYAVQRMPFLLRVQARLAGQQMLEDFKIDVKPLLATVRRLVTSALVVSGVVGVFLLVRRVRR